MQLVPPPPPPPITPIEIIEFSRIDSENKRKQADLELQLKEMQSKNAKMILEFETKIKELELKYNTQLDAAKIKADADLNKLLLSNEYKSFEAAQQSTNQLQQDIESIDAGQKQTPPGNK